MVPLLGDRVMSKEVLDLIPTKIPKELPKMQQLYTDLFAGGKGFRAALVMQVAESLMIPKDQSTLLARCIEFIHNSSLLHDDFVDQAPLRRGKPAAWHEYGSGYAVLAGDYLLARVMKELSEQGSLELINYTSQAILDLVEGEWLQDATLNRIDITQEEINRIHIKKTSSLFSWCFKAPALLLKESKDEDKETLLKIGELFGLLLQRSDDLLDFNIRNFEGKTYFTDIQSGYFNSFMIEVTKDFSDEKKRKVFDFKSLEDFKTYFDTNLENELKSFDLKSTKILEELKQLILSFNFFNKDFQKDLISGAEKIYWRKP